MPAARRTVQAINTQLEKRLGVHLVRVGSPADTAPPAPVRRPADEDDRLLRRPVFLLSSVRSGSTLVRVILNCHSELHAPHETHFRRLSVHMTTRQVRQAMGALDLNEHDLEHLLWDRLLHRELVRSGKPTIVEKTPSNVFLPGRLATAWPDARFVFLVRHPYSIVQSWHEADPPRRPMERAIPHTLHFMRALERARRGYPGVTLRYEDLTKDPEGELRRTCDYLDLPFESGMLDYGDGQHGDFVKGIGDWRDKIRSGSVQTGRPLPSSGEVPPELAEMCRVWGY